MINKLQSGGVETQIHCNLNQTQVTKYTKVKPKKEKQNAQCLLRALNTDGEKGKLREESYNERVLELPFKKKAIPY